MTLMVQSVHKFAHATTAQLSWHVQNCDLIRSLFFKQEQAEYLQDFNYELINPVCNRSLFHSKTPNQDQLLPWAWLIKS